MKLCWDNLNKLNYSTNTGLFRFGNSYFKLVDSCLQCGDPFIALAHRKYGTKYCSKSCQFSGEGNPSWKDGRWGSEDYRKNYRMSHRHLSNSHKAKRRVRQRVTGESFCLERVNNIYWICSRLNTGASRAAFHVDHVVPLSRGGAHNQDNLQIIPAVVNLKKSNKLI